MRGTESLRVFVWILLTVTGGGCPIQLSPPMVTVRYGDPVQINCSTWDLQYATATWEAVAASNAGEPRRRHASWTLPQLTDWNISPICYIKPAPGAPTVQCSRRPTVVVYTFPQSITLSGSGVVTAGQQATFSCDLGAVAPVGGVTVIWYKRHKIVHTNMFTGESREPVAPLALLIFTPTTDHQGAELRCEAHLELDQVQLNVSSAPLVLSVLFGPQLLQRPSGVPEGATLRDQYVVVGNPAPAVTWLKDGRAVDPDTPLSRDDGGRYTLRAEGAAHLEEELHLQVFFGPELWCPSSVAALEAAPHDMGCRVAGRPPPEVTWSKDGEEVELPAHFSRRDAGQYTVFAANLHQRVNASVELSVLYPPAAVLELEASRVAVGGAAWLKCAATGNPRPDYSWSFHRLANVEEESEDGVSRLLIHNASVANAGLYTCHAHNRHGNTSASAQLSVTGADPQCPLLLHPQRLLVPFGDPGHRANCTPTHNASGNLIALHWQVGGVTVHGASWSADGLTDWEATPLCNASFRGMAGTCHRSLELTLYKTPDSVTIRPHPQNDTWLEHTEVTLHCDIINVAPAGNLAVHWYHGNKSISSEVKGSLHVIGCLPGADCQVGGVRTPVNVTSTFNVILRRELSSAEFSCEAELKLEGSERRLSTSSAPFNITVSYKPSINTTKLPAKVPLFRGYPEHLLCEADGAPPPKIQWLFADDLLPRVTGGGLLVSEAGLYTCNATNRVDSVLHQVEVILKEDYLPLIAGFVAVTVVIISVIFIFIYSIYYKNTKMRRYSLKNPKLSSHNGNVAHNGWELQLPVTRLA